MQLDLLGTQSLTLSNPFNAAQSVTIPLLTDLKITLFSSSAGAFITLAIVLAVIAAIANKKTEAAKAKKVVAPATTKKVVEESKN